MDSADSTDSSPDVNKFTKNPYERIPPIMGEGEGEGGVGWFAKAPAASCKIDPLSLWVFSAMGWGICRILRYRFTYFF